jgi:hypothetical protein
VQWTNVKGCCHDQIRGSMWSGTDDKGCCHDSVSGAMWIGKGVKEAFTTNLWYYVDWNSYG